MFQPIKHELTKVSKKTGQSQWRYFSPIWISIGTFSTENISDMQKILRNVFPDLGFNVTSWYYIITQEKHGTFKTNQRSFICKLPKCGSRFETPTRRTGWFCSVQRWRLSWWPSDKHSHCIKVNIADWLLETNIFFKKQQQYNKVWV